MTQGYVIIAQNTSEVDYECCARVLQKSLKLAGDTRPVTIINDVVTDQYGPYYSDTLAYDRSPYDETFKLEADMIVTRSLDSWWRFCEHRNLYIATGCRDIKQQMSKDTYYRKTIVDNKLPDTYNGITYFKKSKIAKQFYRIVETIFKNWKQVNESLEHPSVLKYGDTDTVYAIAASIIGEQLCTEPNNIIQWIHAKKRINRFISEDWTTELTWELVDSDFRINTLSQMYPVHYHVKSLAQLLEPLYDRKIQTLLQQ